LKDIPYFSPNQKKNNNCKKAPQKQHNKRWVMELNQTQRFSTPTLWVEGALLFIPVTSRFLFLGSVLGY